MSDSSLIAFQRFQTLKSVSLPCKVVSHKRSQRKISYNFLIAALPENVDFCTQLIGKEAELFTVYINERTGQQVVREINGVVKKRHGNGHKVLVRMEKGVADKEIGKDIFIKLY